MKTLIVGAGECGRNIALQLYYQLTSMRYTYLLKNFDYFLTDSEDIKRVMSDIHKKGIPAEAINPEKANERIHPLNVFMLSPTNSHAGVGGAWMISSEMAKDFFRREDELNKPLVDLIDEHITRCESFNIFNSAGGGTGNGVGPVFLDHMRSKAGQDSARKLYTATIVLPFERESGGWRDVNAAANIARYSTLCDGILIADNQHVQNMIKQDTKIAQETVNRLLANVWMWMNACSSTNLSISPKGWEGADFKRSFKVGDCGAPVVPCYREEPKERLKKINIGWIVLRTIKENCAALCLPETASRILVIAAMPNKKETPSYESDIVEYLREELFKDRDPEIDVIFLRGRAMQHLSITVLLVSPTIPRLEELQTHFEEYLEDPQIFEEDMVGQFFEQSHDTTLHAYKIEYDNFKHYLEYLKKFS
jgi:hypothetical protein